MTEFLTQPEFVGWKVARVINGKLYGFVVSERYPSPTIEADCSSCGMSKPLAQCVHGLYSMYKPEAFYREFAFPSSYSLCLLKVAHHGDVLVASRGYKSTRITILHVYSDYHVDIDVTQSKLTDPMLAAMNARVDRHRKAYGTIAAWGNTSSVREEQRKERARKLAKRRANAGKGNATIFETLGDVYMHLAALRDSSSVDWTKEAKFLASTNALDFIVTNNQTLTMNMRKFNVGDSVIASRNSWETITRGYVLGSWTQHGGSGFIVLATLPPRIRKFAYCELETAKMSLPQIRSDFKRKLA
jgi:hypothetical protein